MAFKNKNMLLLFGLSFLFLLLIPQASSEYIKVKDDWFRHQETFTVGTDVYDLLITSQNIELLRAKKNDISTLVNLGSCMETEGMKFCYKNYSFDKKADIDSKGNLMPGIHVEISRLKDAATPSMKIDVSSPSTGNKYVYEDNSFLFELKNSGDLSLFNANLIVWIPDNVSVVSRGDFNQITYNQLSRPFSLQKGNEEDFSFDFKILSVGDKKINYEIKSSENELVKSGSFTVRGTVPYSVSISSPTKSDIREIHTFDVLVKNNHPSKDLLVEDLLIKAPESFQYLSFQRLTSNILGQFSSSSIIPPASERLHSIRFRPLFADNYEFSVTADFNLYGPFSFEDSKKLEVINEGFSAGLLFSRKSISLGADNNLVLTLKNDHSTLDFRNIDVTITSDLFNYTTSIDNIASGNSIKVVDQKINPPQIEENKEYVADAVVVFTNEVGQRETLTLSDSFKVLGNDTLLKINRKVSPTKVKAGDEIIVEVSLNNLVGNSFGSIVVEDSFSQRVDVVTGRQSVSSYIGAGEKKDAYLYKIRIPEKPYSDELIIKTTAAIPSLDYVLESSTKVVIEGEIFEDLAPPIGDEDFFIEPGIDDGVVDDSLEPDSSNNEDGESQVPNDESSSSDDNFLRRLVNGIENFFTRLFSRS
jgi:hypothetical protein